MTRRSNPSWQPGTSTRWWTGRRARRRTRGWPGWRTWRRSEPAGRWIVAAWRRREAAGRRCEAATAAKRLLDLVVDQHQDCPDADRQAEQAAGAKAGDHRHDRAGHAQAPAVKPAHLPAGVGNKARDGDADHTRHQHDADAG